jgi:hypothetical protein
VLIDDDPVAVIAEIDPPQVASLERQPFMGHVVSPLALEGSEPSMKELVVMVIYTPGVGQLDGHTYREQQAGQLCIRSQVTDGSGVVSKDDLDTSALVPLLIGGEWAVVVVKG